MRQRWRDPKTRARLFAGAAKGGKAVVRDAAYSEAMSLAKRGEVRSPETRRKISVGNRGKPKSPEHAAKCRVASLGKKFGSYSPDRIWSQRIGMLVNRILFRGGLGQYKRKDKRNGTRWRKWRTAVLLRARHHCEACGIASFNLEAHHLLSQALFPELKSDISNGMALCLKCHVIASAFQRRLEELLWPTRERRSA